MRVKKMSKSIEDEQKRTPEKNSNYDPGSKSDYHAPKLIAHGTLAQLIRGVGGSGTDVGAMPAGYD